MNGKKLLFKYSDFDNAVEGVCFHGHSVVLCARRVHDDGRDVHSLGPSFSVRHVRKRRQRILKRMFSVCQLRERADFLVSALLGR